MTFRHYWNADVELGIIDIMWMRGRDVEGFLLTSRRRALRWVRFSFLLLDPLTQSVTQFGKLVPKPIQVYFDGFSINQVATIHLLRMFVDLFTTWQLEVSLGSDEGGYSAEGCCLYG